MKIPFRIIEDYKNNPAEFDINCVDPLNRSALIAAIENENIELIKLLLEKNINVKVRIARKITANIINPFLSNFRMLYYTLSKRNTLMLSKSY